MICYKTLFILISFTVVSHAAYNYFVKKKKPKSKREIHEAIMFSYEDAGVKKSNYSRIMITKSMDRTLYYLNQSTYNLDICMYVLTNMDIVKSLQSIHLKGVKIRLIVDADMAFTAGSHIKKFAKYGIPVRWMKSTNLMHHKFCLVDTRSEDSGVTPFLMTGSLNWTNQALCGNYENYLVTSQEDLVQQYKAEFERLWLLFKPIVE